LQRLKRTGETIIRVGTGIILASFSLAALFYILGHWTFPKKLYLYEILFSFIGLTSLRLIGVALFPTIYREKVFVVGAGKAGRLISSVLGKNIIGFLDDDASKWVKNDNEFVTGPLKICLKYFNNIMLKK
jgi:FlaA1/EpsC-like NDP-sugar epimerase